MEITFDGQVQTMLTCPISIPIMILITMSYIRLLLKLMQQIFVIGAGNDVYCPHPTPLPPKRKKTGTACLLR